MSPRSRSAVAHANRADVIEAFGRAHDVRYDESTASWLAEMALLAND